MSLCFHGQHFFICSFYSQFAGILIQRKTVPIFGRALTRPYGRWRAEEQMLTSVPEIRYFHQIAAARPASHNLLEVGMQIRFSTSIIHTMKILERRQVIWLKGHSFVPWQRFQGDFGLIPVNSSGQLFQWAMTSPSSPLHSFGQRWGLSRISALNESHSSWASCGRLSAVTTGQVWALSLREQCCPLLVMGLWTHFPHFLSLSQ